MGIGPVCTAGAALVLATTAACTSAPTGEDPSATPLPAVTSVVPSPSPSPAASAPPAASALTPTTSAPAAPLPTAASPVSLPALMARSYDGRDLRVGRVLTRTGDWTRRAVTYRSGDLTISGTLHLPHGDGPFAVVILAHGYIDPAIYTTGRGMTREQDFLARRGIAALHVDYRNHAGSDPDPGADRDLRLGYTEDVINAVLAVRGSGHRRLDPDRIALAGRSMGGGVVQNVLVTQPGLVSAGVAFASVSSDAVDNYERWIAHDRPEVARAIVRRHGSPADNPTFWEEVSPRTYADRASEPLLLLHGTADDTCPPRWARQTARAWRRAGSDVRLVWYDGEGHAFGPRFTDSMRTTVRFLRDSW